MLILFGTRRTEKQLAAGNEYRCPRGGNVRRWPVTQYTSWFSLFFIPDHTSHSKYDADHNNGEYYRCAHIAFPFP